MVRIRNKKESFHADIYEFIGNKKNKSFILTILTSCYFSSFIVRIVVSFLSLPTILIIAEAKYWPGSKRQALPHLSRARLCKRSRP